MKKKVLLIPAVLLLAMSLLAIGCPAPAPPPPPPPAPAPAPAPAPPPAPAPEKVYTLTWNFNTEVGMSNWSVFPYRPGGRWEQLVTEHTNGRIKLDIKTDLYRGGDEPLKAIAAGKVDAGQNLTPWVSGTWPLADYTSLPLLFGLFPQSGLEWYQAQYDPRMQKILNDYFRKSGVVQIGAGITVPTAALWANKAVKRIEDWSGLKTRVPGLIANVLIKALGGSPVVMSIAEVEEALKRGTVDALYTDLPFGLERGLGYFVPYYNHWELAPAFANGMYVNAKVFDALPSDLQEALFRAGKQLGGEMVLNAEQRQRMAFLWLAQTQSELVMPDPGEMDKVAELLRPVYEEWLKIAGPGGKEILAICAEYSTGPAAKLLAELGKS